VIVKVLSDSGSGGDLEGNFSWQQESIVEEAKVEPESTRHYIRLMVVLRIEDQCILLC
jgi:hypothetical protein